jgi:endonuclease YncB( thermonuclease family)
MFGKKETAGLFKMGAILSILILGPKPVALADDLIGQASVIDGDTLEIHGSRIRLWGIDAPESSNLPKIRQSREPGLSIINEKAVGT